MFEVGFTEIIVILGIALVVLGPEKLPKVAAELGRWLGRARSMARQFKSQLDEEVNKAERDWSVNPPADKPAPAAGTPKPPARPATHEQAPAASDASPEQPPTGTGPDVDTATDKSGPPAGESEAGS